MLKISVVIPAYNESARIHRSIQSVLRQTQPVNEIIVVDDGSTDGTADIVAQYADQVTCIRQTNQGLAAARNTGIKQATNDWIAFLDADDEWLPGHIENAWKLLSQYPDIVWYCAAFELRSEDGKILSNPSMADPSLHDGILNNYFMIQANTSFSCASSMIVQKFVFDKVGVFNVEISQHGEDLDMWYRIALLYPQIGYSCTAGCIYWRRKGSITTKDHKTDIPRYLRRINITYSTSKGLKRDSNRESDYLIQTWVIYAIKYAIKQKDRQSLVLIKENFNALLPRHWKFICWFFQNPIALEIVQFALAIRFHIRSSVD